MLELFKKIFAKYIGQLLIMLTVMGGILLAYSKWRDSDDNRKFADLIGTKVKYEQLTKYTAKLESKYQNQKTLAKQAAERFKEVVRNKDERIKVLSDATYLIGKHVSKQNGPDYYFETKRATKNYLLNELRIQGEDSPAIGYILIKHDGKTYKRNYKFEINVETLQTQDEETGHVKVYSKAYLVQKEKSLLAKRVDGYKDWYNVKYPLKIVGGKALIDPTLPYAKSKMRWWAPHINGGINLLGHDYRSSLDVSISGYGKTNNDLKYKLFHFGADIGRDKEIGYHFIPFSYRLFDRYLTNTYIGPGVGWAASGVHYFLNINLTF